MSLTRLTTNLNNIQSLADQPTETASELKILFDKAANDIKNYINNTLLEEIETKYMTSEGGTLAGALNTRTLRPILDGTYTLGNPAFHYAATYTDTLRAYEGIEMYNDSHTTPYIDFHYNGSDTDYTSRIIEVDDGTLQFLSPQNTTGRTEIQMGQLKSYQHTFLTSGAYIKDDNNGNMYITTAGALYIRGINNFNSYMPIYASSCNSVSSRRYKENIVNMTEEEADKILDVNIVKFDYINKENGINVAGVIAEDVYNVIPGVVTMAEIDGKSVPNGVDYSKFVPYLIKKVQMLEERING